MKSRFRIIASLYFFGSTLFFMVVLSLMGYFLVYREHRLALEKIDELKQGALQEQKELVRNQVDFAGNYIAFKKIQTIRFGDGGYLFVIKSNGIVLAHIDPEMIGRNGVKAGEGTSLPFEETLLKAKEPGGGFIEYDWIDPETGGPSRTLSYVSYDWDWNWIIGGGLFAESIEKMIAQTEDQERSHLKRTYGYMGILFLALFMAAAFLSFGIYGRIHRGFQVFEDFFARGAGKHETIDTGTLPFPEFQKLADSANEMVREREKAETILRESEERFRMITSTARDGIILIDGNGNVQYWNPAAASIFGYTGEEVMGRELHALLAPPRYREAYKKGLETFQDKGTGNAIGKTLELEGLRKGGRPFSLELSLSSIQLKGKWHALGVVRDITERKKMEEELRRIGKFESLAVLSSGISHDFNNLLSIIMGNISLARESLSGETETHALLAEAEKASRKAGVLVRRLTSLTRRETCPVQGTDLETVLRKSMEDQGLSPAHEISLSLSDALNPVAIPPEELKIVLDEVISNAVEAMEEGGILEIEGIHETVPRDGFLPGNPREETPFVRVTLRDTGEGIPEDQLNRIFDPYFTTKERGSEKGTGIGLSAVYSIIQKWEGHIAVKSVIGKGTEVTLWIPAAAKEEI